MLFLSNFKKLRVTYGQLKTQKAKKCPYVTLLFHDQHFQLQQMVQNGFVFCLLYRATLENMFDDQTQDSEWGWQQALRTDKYEMLYQ